MAEVDDLNREFRLDEDRQDAVLIISKDGEVLMIEPSYAGEQPEHVVIIEGLARALADPILFIELKAIVDRAIATAPEIDFDHPPTLQ